MSNPIQRCYILMLSSLLLSANVFSQNGGDRICDCIVANYLRIGISYEELLGALEEDLVSSKITDRTQASRSNQIRNVSQTGRINEFRLREFFMYEQRNYSIIKFCSNLHSEDLSPDAKFLISMMFYELEKLDVNSSRANWMEQYRKETASIILAYSDELSKMLSLFKVIQLHFLYKLSETKELRALDKVIHETNDAIAAADAIKVSAGDIVFKIDRNNVLSLNDKAVAEEEVCSLIRPYFKNGNRVLLTSERMTNYKSYLAAYNELNGCYTATLEEKSQEYFSMSVGQLSTEQKEEIKKIVPYTIVEVIYRN